MAGALWGSICTSGPKSYQSGVQAPVFKGATMETDRQTAGQTDGRELCATASKYLQTLGGFTSGGRGHRDTVTSNEHVVWSH